MFIGSNNCIPWRMLVVDRYHLCHSPQVVSIPQNQEVVSWNTAMHWLLGTLDLQTVSCLWYSPSWVHCSAGFCTGQQRRTWSWRWCLTAADWWQTPDVFWLYIVFNNGVCGQDMPLTSDWAFLGQSLLKPILPYKSLQYFIPRTTADCHVTHESLWTDWVHMAYSACMVRYKIIFLAFWKLKYSSSLKLGCEHLS